MDLQKAFDAGFDAVKRYVDDIIDQVEERLIALEKRAPERGEPGPAGEPGADGARGADGVGLADIVRDADGNLIAVMSDGRTKAIGNIAVRDGKDGDPGEKGDAGPTGAGVSDIDVELVEEGRTAVFRFTVGDVEHAFEVALPEGPAGRDGANGRDADVDAVRAMIDEAVARAVEAIPVPKDGKDADPEAVRAMVDEAVGAAVTAAVAAMPAPVAAEDVLPALEKRVDEFLAAIPAPKDGAPGPEGPAGRDGAPGRDGLDVKDLFRADGGRLVAVMSDGTVKDLGVIQGNDGVPGKDGEPGRDGRDGRDGVDGVGFDDLDLVEDDDGLKLRFVRGDNIKEFPLPVVVDRGIYREGVTFRKGSGATYGGSYWIAREDTSSKPGTDNTWRLAVKAGRDGKSVPTAAPQEEKQPIRLR